MRPSGWSKVVSGDVASRRAGGRRRYNAMRQLKAWERRMELAETFGLMALVMSRGVKIRAAEYLGVSPATITRDVRAIFRLANNERRERLWKIERRLLTIKFKQAIKEVKSTEARQARGNSQQKKRR